MVRHCIARLALASCLALARAAPALAASTAEEDWAEARQAWSQADLPRALELLRQAQGKAPSLLYAFNLARVLEELGEYREAAFAFQSALVMELPEPDITAEQRERFRTLARDRLGALAALKDRAVVRVGGPEERLWQLDGRLVAAGVDTPTEPGPHLLCSYAPDHARGDCRTEELPAGKRVSLGPTDPRRPRGTLTWDGRPGVTVWRLDGVALLVDPRRLRALDVDPGAHQLGLEPIQEAPGALAVPAGVTLALHEQMPAPAIDPGPWVLVAVGAAGIASGIALIAASEATRREVREASRDAQGYVTGLTEREAEARWAAADALAIGAGVAGAVGVLALTAGITWWALARDPESPVEPTPAAPGVTLAPWPGLGLTLGVRY